VILSERWTTVLGPLAGKPASAGQR